MATAPTIIDVLESTGRRRRLVIRFDAESPIPPYEQLRAQLAVMVAVGGLAPRTRLPTIRGLADTLGLSPGTVARAYRELEHDGVLVGRGRRGTFVVDEPPASEPTEERQRRLEVAAAQFVAACRQLGIGADAALRAANSAFGDEE